MSAKFDDAKFFFKSHLHVIHILSINICQPKSLLNTTVVSSPAHQCIPGIHYALHIKKNASLKTMPSGL